MKIVGVSNFDDDTVDDILIAENVNQPYGERIVGLLEKDCGENGYYFPKLVDDNYELYDASSIY